MDHFSNLFKHNHIWIYVVTLLLFQEHLTAGYRRSRKMRLKGPPGMPGLPGPKGRHGFIGRPGNIGAMGYPGPIGSTGEQGVKGIEGIKGFQGVMGLDGPIGPPGKSAFCPDNKRVLCATGLVGAPGKQGSNGGKGERGHTGHSGDIGEEGPVGDPGNRGRSGRSGSRGLLTRIECRSQRTKFVRPYRFKNKRHQFSCNETKLEFLRGFSIESRGDKIRYNYRCCWFMGAF